MYENHFGLKKRPFRAKAVATDVFVGPNIAAAMAGIKKALASSDAIVTVSGPVGSGKTTMVNRALESMSDNCRVVHISRMRLGSNDILDFLLDELEVTDLPNGAIRKFTSFRRRLKELQDSDQRVLISIEDAVRLGADTLAEIEALSSADAGESDGAALVLMGDDRLQELLSDGTLARLHQRLFHRYTLQALCANELRGYLRHCFRLAGQDFEQVFEPNAAELLHHVSHGVPRVVNNIVESALRTAAEQDASQVSTALIARIAENEFGLSAAGFDLTAAIVEADIAEAIVESEEIQSEVPDDDESGFEQQVDDDDAASLPILELPPEVPDSPLPELQTEAVSEDADADIATANVGDEIPELIQDTLPDLQVLAPELTAAAKPELVELPTLQLDAEDPVTEQELQSDIVAELAALEESEPVDVPEPAPQPAPVAEPTVEPVAVSAPTEPAAPTASSEADEVPAWDRDPTLAELRPDLDALELAMAHTISEEPDATPVAIPTKPVAAPTLVEIPEITLDHAISQRIENKLIDEPGEVSPPKPAEESPAENRETDLAIELPKKPVKKADAELEHIAAELAKAKSIEDVDDKMAETLFGEELNFAAAQVLANPPSHPPANDADDSDAAGEPQVAAGTPASDMEVTLEAPRRLDSSGMDLSASQRLKTVRALNADLHPSLREPSPAAKSSAPATPPPSTPDSIEDQINTSMTQTLKALNVKPPINDDDDTQAEKSGFFSRFKR